MTHRLNLIFLAFLFQNSFSSKAAPLLTVGLPVHIKHIDPLQLDVVEEWEIYASIHETLIKYDSTENYLPAAAQKWEYNSTDKTLTFFLRSDLAFSDGSPLTTLDVANSLKRLLILDKKRKTTFSKCFPILEIQKLKKLEDDFKYIKIVDGLTIRIHIPDCNQTVLSDFVNANLGIVSAKSLYKDLGINYNRLAV